MERACIMATLNANDGNVTTVDTVNGNVNISCTNNKNSIVQLPVQSPIPNLINFRVVKPEAKFTGRSMELHQIKKLLEATDVAVVVSGMGGVGKTQLAKKFIEENRSNYENVIWIDSETEQGVTDAFNQLAQDVLYLSTINANGKEKDSRAVIEQVLQRLCEGKTLFVYDNIDSIQSMNFLLGMALPPKSVKPNLLITSRLQRWPTGISVMPLKVWNQSESIEYITKMLINSRSDSETNKELLAETLQYFPLALRQATAFISLQRERGDYKIAKYIDEFSRRTHEMLNSTTFQEDSISSYNSTTYTTWSVTIGKIQNDKLNGSLALRIFNIIAYWEANFIDRDSFRKLSFDNENEHIDDTERWEHVKSAVDLLVKYCMVDSRNQQQRLSIHRLVQKVTKFKLKESHDEESVLRDALRLISKYIFEGLMHYLIRPHVFSIFVSSLPYPNLVKEFASISVAIAKTHCFLNGGEAKKIEIAFLEPLINILGENDRALLKFRYYLTRSYLKQATEKANSEERFYDLALQMSLEIFEKQKTHFGDGDPDTLQTQCQIAYVYDRRGNDMESLRWYEEALKIKKNILGEDYSAIFQNMLEIANGYMSENNCDSARKLYQFIFEKQKSCLGADHPDCLATLPNVDLQYKMLRQNSKALRLY